MPTYDSMITRVFASGILEPEYANAIIQGMPAASVLLPRCTQLPVMSSDERYIPIADTLPTAHFRNPKDTGYRETTTMEWSNISITIEDLSVMVVVPKNLVADAKYPIWDHVRPRMSEAVARKIEETILYSSDADGWEYMRPASWPNGIVVQATALSRSVSLAANSDLYDAVLAENSVYSLIEQHGYLPTANLASPKMRGRMRGARDSSGRPLFEQGQLDGVDVLVPSTGAFNETHGMMVTGDFSKIVYAIREDIEFQIADQGVISDPATGRVIYNLLQQKLVAIFLDLRIGWQLPRPVNWHKTNKNDKPFPFAVLTA